MNVPLDWSGTIFFRPTLVGGYLSWSNKGDQGDTKAAGNLWNKADTFDQYIYFTFATL